MPKEATDNKNPFPILPDAQFEEKQDCPHPDCPIDKTLPRVRFLMHVTIGNEDTEEVNGIAMQIGKLLNDLGVKNPAIAAKACLVLQEAAWRQFKKMVESGQIKYTPN